MLIETIHPDDDLFHADDAQHYKRCGSELAAIVGDVAGRQSRVLEIPCGHGRVTRYLLQKIDRENLWTADILPSAIEFQRDVLKTQAMQIDPNEPTYTHLPDDMDVVLVGSLITHLTEFAGVHFLSQIVRKLRKGGVLILTTHGARSYEMLREANIYHISEVARERLLKAHDERSFAFIPYDENHNNETVKVATETQSYGLTMMHKDWLVQRMKGLGMSLEREMVGGWDNHQDVFLFSRD